MNHLKTLYLDCSMGAAGDMLTAALLELVEDKEKMLEQCNAIGLPNVKTQAQPAVKCGIHGTYISVAIHGTEESELLESIEHVHEHEHSHPHAHHVHTHEPAPNGHQHQPHTSHRHTSLADIEAILQTLHIPDEVRTHAIKIYHLLAEAEARAHGSTKDAVHFHEVGMLDAIADIVNVCLLLHELDPDQILVSPINTGSGQVHCAHGILPVPAPATAYILQDMPIYHNAIQGELCTPTGAAILKHFASPCETMPILKVKKIGYGMGHKDFPAANCVRSFLGETSEDDEILELSCNLDDMTPEDIGYAQERLLSIGALDVYTMNIGMKKSRPGIMLNCICKKADKETMLHEIFKNTTTIGIREYHYNRYKMHRLEEIRQTALGRIRIKKATGYGVERSKAEYEDIKKIAEENHLSLTEVRKLLD